MILGLQSPIVRYSALILMPVVLATLLLPGLRDNLFSGTQFMPHATCYLQDPRIIWLHVLSDSLIGLAYLSISGTLAYLVYRARREIPFHWMFLAFGLFIVTCGFTHFMEVWTVWQPYYWLSGEIKLITAVASVATAFALPPLVPRVFAMIEAVKISEERKRQLELAHAELETLYKKVTDLDQLRSRFFTNVSHELRTPLVLILGPTDDMLTDPAVTPRQTRHLHTIRRNSEILLKRVNDLLDMAKLDAGQMTALYSNVDLAELTRLAASPFESLARERQIDFVVETPPSLDAQVDSSKVERILLNLLSNAFKFAPERGAIRCVLRAESDRAVINVQDNGPGIPAEMREAIFERFRRIESGPHSAVGGTGLGLSIVKEFVELQGGTVTLTDSPGGGALFTIELPLRAPSGASLRNAPDPKENSGPINQALAEFARIPGPEEGPAANSAAPTVLVVEDNVEMNRFIRDVLKTEFNPVAATNGREALGQVEALKPELVVTDLMMPEMDGEQFVRELRARPEFERIPILLLTAKADDATRTRLLRGGAQDYLVKPFLIEELRARVGNLVAMKRAREKAVETANRLQEVNAELEAFSYSVSHDLRAPLRAMRGLATALLEDYGSNLDPTGQDFARRIVAAGLQMDSLISALLSYSQITRTEIQLQPTELRPAIEEAQRQVEAVLQERQTQVSVEVNEMKVQAYRPVLVQAISNLLSNASKFVAAEKTPSIHLRAEEHDGWVRVSIQDNGIGIRPEDHERVFRVFERLHTSREFPGTGIGLAIVMKGIKRMGGRVGLDSEPDAGSTFWFELPKA